MFCEFRNAFIVFCNLLVIVSVFQDSSVSLEDKIMRHEDNLRFLTNQTNQLDESILDLQGRVFYLSIYFYMDLRRTASSV